MLFFKKKKSCHIPGLDLQEYGIKIVLKKIRHIYFRVNPQNKTILISAPEKISEDQLNQAILSKKDWIEKQVRKQNHHKTDIHHHILNDRTIPYLGRKYPVHVYWDQDSVRMDRQDNGHFSLYIPPDTSWELIESLTDAWYRKELKQIISCFVEKWQPVLGVKVNEYKVRKMKSRWGSCNISDRRIWLNFHLIKLEPCFIEYVVVHEMVHLLEKGHGFRFKQLMTRSIPQWPDLKKQLNQYIL